MCMQTLALSVSLRLLDFRKAGYISRKVWWCHCLFQGLERRRHSLLLQRLRWTVFITAKKYSQEDCYLIFANCLEELMVSFFSKIERRLIVHMSGAMMFIIYIEIDWCAPHHNFSKNHVVYQCKTWHVSTVKNYLQSDILDAQIKINQVILLQSCCIPIGPPCIYTLISDMKYNFNRFRHVLDGLHNNTTTQQQQQHNNNLLAYTTTEFVNWRKPNQGPCEAINSSTRNFSNG